MLQEACIANNKPVPKLSADALNMLARYSWPGNVRELKHTAEYIAVLGNDDWVRPKDFPHTISGEVSGPGKTFTAKPARVYPRDLTKGKVNDAIRKCRGNMRNAAIALKISHGSLYKLLKQFGIR
jgi:sigma-54 dependent transcriptional regulator, acetoin dehydrogenase operon transcriptional activator AcoR